MNEQQIVDFFDRTVAAEHPGMGALIYWEEVRSAQVLARFGERAIDLAEAREAAVPDMEPSIPDPFSDTVSDPWVILESAGISRAEFSEFFARGWEAQASELPSIFPPYNDPMLAVRLLEEAFSLDLSRVHPLTGWPGGEADPEMAAEATRLKDALGARRRAVATVPDIQPAAEAAAWIISRASEMPSEPSVPDLRLRNDAVLEDLLSWAHNQSSMMDQIDALAYHGLDMEGILGSLLAQVAAGMREAAEFGLDHRRLDELENLEYDLMALRNFIRTLAMSQMLNNVAAILSCPVPFESIPDAPAAVLSDRAQRSMLEMMGTIRRRLDALAHRQRRAIRDSAAVAAASPPAAATGFELPPMSPERQEAVAKITAEIQENVTTPPRTVPQMILDSHKRVPVTPFYRPQTDDDRIRFFRGGGRG